MLDLFWSSLEIDDINELQYMDDVPYSSVEQKEDVIEKIDWVILKLHRKKDKRAYDYKMVTMMKNNIKINNYSLNLRGIEYLNSVTRDIKNDVF